MCDTSVAHFINHWFLLQLERMKNENSHFSQANHDPYVQDLQRELMHLNKVVFAITLYNFFNNVGAPTFRIYTFPFLISHKSWS